MRIALFPFWLLATASLVLSCGGPKTASTGGTGGGIGSGGATGTGGAPSSGGTIGSGGTSSGAGTGGSTVVIGGTGGAPGSGGTVSAGGTTSTGGSLGNGGNGGTTSAGGSLGKGGNSGTTSAGGTTSTGGGGPGGTVASEGGNATGGTAIGGTGAGGRASGGATGSGGTIGLDGGPATGGSRGDAGVGCTPPTTYANLFVTVSGHTQAESDTKVAAAWSKLFNPSGPGNIYFNGPGTDESYVKDIYNGDVRTEGMSYGMMTAVQLDHQTEYDRLWAWVKNHMANGTGEISWSCSTSGGKNSSGGAPDGEEYFATALIFAHNRWGDSSGRFKYATEAQWVLDLIRTKYFNTTYHIVKFVSGSNNTDGSYILPAFYQVWACFDTANADFWNTAVTSARAFFPKITDANGVIPDQSSFTGGQAVGPGSDTIRCVMNIMMDHNFFNAAPWQTDTYATKFAAHETNQNGTARFPDALLGFGLPASSGKAFVDKLWSAGIPTSYWDGVLYTLALLHVSGTFHLYY